MAKVRAKFKCDSVLNTEHNKTANLSPVYGNSGENKDFTDATPFGKLEIGISGDVPAADFFEVGKEYYLDFTPAN